VLPSASKELQALAAEHSVETADKCVRELNDLRQKATDEKAYGAAVSAVMGKAKILNLTSEQPKQLDFKAARSIQDIGRKLLQSVGFASPDDASAAAAIQANDAFVARLEAIRDQAQATIEQDN
jgi:hypothetical protein